MAGAFGAGTGNGTGGDLHPARDLAIVDPGRGFAAKVARVLYQGGRTVVEAAPAADPDTTLSLSLQSSDACARGAHIHLALLDGWVIPGER